MDAKDILHFLDQLAANNNREWFNEHRDEYLRCKKMLEDFTAKWLEQMKKIDPQTADLQVKDCVYRIYRDTRFSRNKTPYKNWIGLIIAPHGGRNSKYGCYYLHIEPGKCHFAGGIWCPEPDIVKALRQDIYDNYEELEKIFALPEVAPVFQGFDTREELKRIPAPFPKNFPHPTWISRRSFTFEHRLTDEEIADPNLMEHLLTLCRAAKPINDFLNYTLDNPR